VALFALALVAAVALGRSIADGQIMLVGLVAGFVVIVALIQAPWLPYVACCALVATLATPSSLPQFGIPGNPTLQDLLLVAAFASWLILLSRGDAESPGNYPLPPQFAIGVFLVAAALGIVVGASNGARSPLVDARDIAYYASYWLALTAFTGRARRELVFRIAAYAAVAVVIAQVAQGFTGPGLMLFYDADPTRELIGCPSGDCADPWAQGFPRVRPPGIALVYVVACFAASHLLWGPQHARRRVGALLAVCGLGLLVSLNRNMLIGLTAGLVVTALVSRRRGRFAVVATVAAIVGFAAFEVAAASPELEGNSIVARVLSITAVSELESSATVSERVEENDAALDVLAESPIEGLGWGVPFGRPSLAFVDGEFQTREKHFIHNQYLALWMRAGLLGLVAFVAALAIAAAYGTRWLRTESEDDAWIGAGVVTSVTAIAASSIVAIYLVHPTWAPVVAGLLALATTLRREQIQP
jgi:O-antigen ligase